MKCISLFSGAGGLDLGLEAAGFDVVTSIELDSDCCETLRRNHRRRVIQADVSQVEFAKLKGATSIALLAGGPPCQPFSKSALWTQRGARGLSDRRTDTIDYFLKAISQLQPRAFVLENVEGFDRGGGLALVNNYADQLKAAGSNYSVTSAVLDAADFGVPQKRRRFFAVGLLGQRPFEFPRATHGELSLPCATAWDACALAPSAGDEDLKVKGRWADLLPSIPPGRNYLWHTSRGGGLPLFGWRTRFWSFLYKLDPFKPSPTIVASPSQNSGPFHWNNRLLSTLELAALQTFPLSYHFAGNRASRLKQIGNAVPPLMAEVIGRALIARLGATPSNDLTYAVPAAEALPHIEESSPVPLPFHRYIGTHAAHPGTGLGPKPRGVPTQQEEERP